MSSSAARPVHQDYIARIRYSNALPPPPNPPKLLDIPNTGLASGQYTNPGFASRLARDQPLNIEADAELGMPLDLVGMPGIFDGDESSIQAPMHLPPTHAHDRALLRPLSTLGKPKFTESGVSFLRRTEYISSHQSKSRFDSTTSKSLIRNTGGRFKKPVVHVDKDSREYVKDQIEKDFQKAAALVKDSTQLRHPSKRTLHLIESIPLIPDLDSFPPDAGGYCTIKFLTNPVPSSSTYDTRLESSILRPIALSDHETAEREAAAELHARDPERNPPPESSINYEFFVTETPDQARNFKRRFDVLDEDKDDASLYTHTRGSNNDEPCFRFKRVRAYETATIQNILDKYDDEVMIAIYDGSDGLRKKGAYYYPILQRMAIRPQRTKNINKNKMQRQGASQADDDLDETTDFVTMTVEAMTKELQESANAFKENPISGPQDEEAEADEEAEETTPPPAAGEDDAKC
ncbi:Paf1-domain-containing protein, partial [Calycina marina]